jgi:hypothetical protein
MTWSGYIPDLVVVAGFELGGASKIRIQEQWS